MKRTSPNRRCSATVLRCSPGSGVLRCNRQRQIGCSRRWCRAQSCANVLRGSRPVSVIACSGSVALPNNAVQLLSTRQTCVFCGADLMSESRVSGALRPNRRVNGEFPVTRFSQTRDGIGYQQCRINSIPRRSRKHAAAQPELRPPLGSAPVSASSATHERSRTGVDHAQTTGGGSGISDLTRHTHVLQDGAPKLSTPSPTQTPPLTISMPYCYRL
jgi:hypothetical protein